MSEPFKPGDKVRDPHVKEIEYTVFEATETTWRTASSAWMLSENFELVDPSVPVSRIREVCERHKAAYSNVNLQMAVALLRAELLEAP